MKVVVADTSPLNYLILIGEVDVLQQLYGDVLVPDVVVQELRDSGAPQQVSRWASQLPPWIKAQPTPASTQHLERLDPGERAAILLAEAQTSPVLLLIDDAAGRDQALRRRIPVTGTLGILRAAAIREFTDLPSTLMRLRATNFRCSPTLFDELLADEGRRRQSR